jgi:hypothetical protein
MGGADGLWRVRPSARDILDAIDGSRVRGDDGDGEDDMTIVHAILEAGACSAGGGMDASPFFDAYITKCVIVVSVEPIAVPDAGTVLHEDARAMYSLVDGINPRLLPRQRMSSSPSAAAAAALPMPPPINKLLNKLSQILLCPFLR